MACQAQGESRGNLPELGRCCCVGLYLQRWVRQEGTGPSAITVTFHTKVLSHAGLGEKRSFGETREVVWGEICGRRSVMWTEMQCLHSRPAL